MVWSGKMNFRRCMNSEGDIVYINFSLVTDFMPDKKNPNRTKIFFSTEQVITVQERANEIMDDLECLK